MKILVIGSGGREHALTWKIAQSPKVSKVFCAPGNPGTSQVAENIPIASEDLQALLQFAKKEQIDMTVVGPEQPLSLGIVNLFLENNLPIFGPTREAARLEGSKAFSKSFMKKYNIPTGLYEVFSSASKAKAFLKNATLPIVIKADGLAAGKGVVICKTLEEAESAVHSLLVEKKFGPAGDKVVIEEFLDGEEASFMALCDGVNILPFVCARDHKQVFDGNRGPNTGGMGAYAPSPLITEELEKKILNTVIVPAVRAMASEGNPFTGVLYAGVMIKEGEVKTLEFNCRLGDPETQPLLMKLDTDIVTLFEATMSGTLHQTEIRWKDDAAACIVLASGGYPGSFQKGKVISGLDLIETGSKLMVFHAGTAKEANIVVTSGGRVLGITALGKDPSVAISNAYKAAQSISWEGIHYRKDIGRA
ncbi:MAG: phosphoribosylamine--glycine ligase [Nitrospinota bacterium]